MPCVTICDSTGSCSTDCFSSGNSYPMGSGLAEGSGSGSGFCSSGVSSRTGPAGGTIYSYRNSSGHIVTCYNGGRAHQSCHYDQAMQIVARVNRAQFRAAKAHDQHLSAHAYGKLYCILQPVPDKDIIWGGAPFKYVYGPHDSPATKGLKSTYNELVDKAFDDGFPHWAEGLLHAGTEKMLREQVEKACGWDFYRFLQDKYPEPHNPDE